MSEDKNNDAFILRVDVWRKENGKWTEFVTTYATDGIGDKDIVDFGNYWDLNNDDYLRLHTEDDKFVYVDLDEFSEVFLDDKCDWKTLDWTRDISSLSIGGWHEAVHNNWKVRITRIAELPRLSKARTLKESDLSIEAKTRIKIYGVPLFREGEALHNKVYMPRFTELINEVWENYIRQKSGGVAVKIAVDESMPSADYYSRDITMTADTEDALRNAISALGCVNPAEVEVVTRHGENERETYVSTRFSIVNKIV